MLQNMENRLNSNTQASTINVALKHTTIAAMSAQNQTHCFLFLFGAPKLPREIRSNVFGAGNSAAMVVCFRACELLLLEVNKCTVHVLLPIMLFRVAGLRGATQFDPTAVPGECSDP